MLSYSQAHQQLLQQNQCIAASIDTPLDQALQRICAMDVLAPIASPAEANSAVDGFAIDAATPLNQTIPIHQYIAAGDSQGELAAGSAARIFTGGLIPNGCDWVVMQEHCDFDDHQVTIKHRGTHNNIRLTGEDFAQGELLVSQGQVIDAFKLGLLARAGVATVLTYRPLSIALLSSGDELLQLHQPWSSGQVYDSNMPTIFAILSSWGLPVSYSNTLPDDRQETKKILQEAASQSQLIITCGGVSVGDKDVIKAAISELGTLEAWRVAMKPGKPIAWGHIGETVCLGLPGNPVSAAISLLMLGRLAIFRLQGMGTRYIDTNALKVRSGFDYATSDRCDFVRVRLHCPSNELASAQLKAYDQQQSHISRSLDWADGLAMIPSHQRITLGNPVDYYPFNQLLSLS